MKGLGSINDNVSAVGRVGQAIAESKADEELKALIARVELMQGIICPRVKLRLVLAYDSGNYCDWLYGRFNCESCE